MLSLSLDENTNIFAQATSFVKVKMSKPDVLSKKVFSYKLPDHDVATVFVGLWKTLFTISRDMSFTSIVMSLAPISSSKITLEGYIQSDAKRSILL